MAELISEFQHGLDTKRERRLALARLPYEEKLRILIELQTIAAPLLRARGGKAVIFRPD
ncbi:MAG: hypothetical protein ABSF43_01565 [Rectinemataceae bacterium]|jgi:hypothetical protein